MATPENKPRRKRQKATTELGRQMMQKQRQRLAQEEAELAEKMAREAQANRDLARPIEKAPKLQVGVNRSIVRRVAAVLASEGVVVPIRCEAAEASQQMSAWTDFEQIAIRYEVHDDPRLLAATLRGLIYHEGGHIRWSAPFVDLAAMAGKHIDPYNRDLHIKALHTAWNVLEDQRMETAVVCDSPRKAAYFTPMVMTVHTVTVDKMAANWPLLVWRRYLPVKLRQQARAMFVTRHGAVGEHLAQELDRIVSSYVLADLSTEAPLMWRCVEEMLAVLQMCQPLASNMEDAGHGYMSGRTLPENFEGLTIPVTPEMLEQNAAPAGEQQASEDPTSSADLSPEEMEHVIEVLIAAWNAPETLIEVRYVIDQPAPAEGSQDDGTGSLLSKDQDPAKGQDPAPSPAGEDEGDEGADASPAGEDGDDEGDAGHQDERTAEDEEVDGQAGQQDEAERTQEDEGGAEDEAADDKSVEGSGGSGSGSHDEHGSEDAFTQEDLDEMLQEAEAERYEQRELDADMDAFHDAVDNGVTDLDVYNGGYETNSEAIATAETLAQDIEDAFHAHTMDRAPAWVEQQRRGVLNVGRYMTRAPGDSEFFRQYTDSDAPGYNIAVSLLLDYSGSMGWAMGRLAQAGYATKLACQKLEIPCTVALWDTEALTLWDANETAEHLPTIQSNGGTVPDIALADLDNQRCDRERHIVLIMTDGSWQGRWSGGGGTLAWYKDDGRTIYGFGFGRDDRTAQGNARRLSGYGCDEAVAITDLMAIPQFLEGVLLDLA